METASKPLQRKRGKKLLLPLLTGVPVILILGIIVCHLKPEALSPDEILAKQNWNDQELQTALARSMSPSMTGQRKREIRRHLNKQLKKRPKEEQEKIRKGAIVQAVRGSLQQLRTMPEEERIKTLNAMQKRAEKNYRDLVSHPREREKAEAMLQTPEMQAFTGEVNKIIFSGLSPAERVQFAPLTKLWIKTMKTMGQ